MSDAMERFKALEEFHKSGQSLTPTQRLLQFMPAATAARFRLCAIPHHFSADLIHALCPELSAEESVEQCAEFAELAIVSATPDLPGHFTIHDQARRELFAEWMRPENQEAFRAANDRLLRHLETMPKPATPEERERAERQRLFHLIPVDPPAGIALFAEKFREYRNALRWNEGEILCRFVHEYDPMLSAEAKAVLAYNEGKLRAEQRDWKSAEALFLAVAQTHEIPADLRAKALYRRGMILCAQREYRAATASCQEALHIAQGSGVTGFPVHRITHELAVVARESGDCDEALRLLQHSIVLAREKNDPADLATLYNSLGDVQKRLREPARAREAYETSLKYLDAAGDKFRRAQALGNVGALQADESDWAGAETSFRISLAVQSQAGDLTGQARTLASLARVLQNLGKTDEAKQASDTAASIFRDVRDFHGAGVAMRNLARLHRLGRNSQLARVAYVAATSDFRRANAAKEIETVEQELATLDRKIGIPWWVWVALALLGAYLGAAVLWNAAGGGE